MLFSCTSVRSTIGKQAGAWGLDKHAPEAQAGFLLNHLIAEHLPTSPDGRRYSNSDPVTGQAAWFDLRVDVVKCAPGEEGIWPLVERLATETTAPDVLRWTVR